MNPFREMILLSTEEYTNLKRRIQQEDLPRMQQELNEVKERYGNLPTDQYIKLEGDVIAKHTQLPEKPNITIAPEVAVPNDELLLHQIDNFPKTNKRRAVLLYQHLKNYSHAWNQLGQLVDDNNSPIDGSNIVDLIDYVTNSTKFKVMGTPIAFNQFTQMLEQSNTPQTLYSSAGMGRIKNYKHKLPHEKDEQTGSGAKQFKWINIA